MRRSSVAWFGPPLERGEDFARLERPKALGGRAERPHGVVAVVGIVRRDAPAISVALRDVAERVEDGAEELPLDGERVGALREIGSRDDVSWSLDLKSTSAWFYTMLLSSFISKFMMMTKMPSDLI